jgi:hypothetical protein
MVLAWASPGHSHNLSAKDSHKLGTIPGFAIPIPDQSGRLGMARLLRGSTYGPIGVGQGICPLLGTLARHLAGASDRAVSSLRQIPLKTALEALQPCGKLFVRGRAGFTLSHYLGRF